MSLQQSFDHSRFGRQQQQKQSSKRIKLSFRKMVHQLISYSKVLARKLKKRNQHQLILFPNQQKEFAEEPIDAILSEHYQPSSQYLFYLSNYDMFIDNYHLKLLKKTQPLAVKFNQFGYGKLKWFSQWVQCIDDDFLIGVTDLNWVLVIALKRKDFMKYKIGGQKGTPNTQIISVCTHRDYLFIYSQQECHVLKYNNLKHPKGMDRIIHKKINERNITKGYGFEKEDKLYAVFIVNNSIILQRLEEGLLSKIDNKQRVLHKCEQADSEIKNMNIYPQRINGAVSHIIIVMAVNKQAIVMSYNLQTQITTVLTQKANPYFSWWRFQKHFVPFLGFISRQSYLYCLVGFNQQLFFIKILPDYCQVSKRVKFEGSIQFVGEMGKGLVIILNTSTKDKNKKKIYLTLESNIVSFSQCVNLMITDKYEFQFQLSGCGQSLGIYKSIYLYQKNELMFICDSHIDRITLNDWTGIYNEMKRTQNIKLLKFIILLKHVDSPFLTRPSSFSNLQLFFPCNSNQTKQILLQYYYAMDLEPVLINVMEEPKLMIPFILAHKIYNLSDSIKEQLMNWCLTFDKRLVQQMIVGGSTCGWEVAVRYGWIRAFKTMIEGDMQIEMPILKLFSMAISQRKMNQGGSELSELGLRYVNQIIQYILYVLSSFFHSLTGDGSSQQLKLFIKLILKQDIWLLLITSNPQKAVNIISLLFITERRVKQINHFPVNQFLQYHYMFSPLILTQGYSNSQIVLSHLSQTYQLHSPSTCITYLQIQHSKLIVLKYEQFINRHRNFEDNFMDIQQLYLIVNSKKYTKEKHSKLLLKCSDKFKSNIFFMFQKDYLKQILITLIQSDSVQLQAIYREYRTQFETSPNAVELDCEMIQFVVHIWHQIYLQIIKYSLTEKQGQNKDFNSQDIVSKIRRSIKQEVCSLLAQVQQCSYDYQYLAIHMMMAINNDNQFTFKIFNKFLTCKNQIIKTRIFLWLKESLFQNSQLQQEMIKKLKQVIDISKEDSRYILQQFYQKKEKEIIKKIDNDPALQLEYVQLIIKNSQDQLQKYYTNLHIELVLKLKPWQLISILDANNEKVEYDLTQALRLTLNKGDFQMKNQILIYLYEREGEIVQCINTYLVTLQHLVFAYIAHTQKYKIDQQDDLNLSYHIPNPSSYNNQKIRLVEEIDSKFQQSLNLIFQQPQVTYTFIDMYLNKVNELLKTISMQNYRYNEHYIQFASQFMGQLILKLFQKKCIHHLSSWLQGHTGKLDFMLQVMPYFIQGYDKLAIDNIILNRMVAMQRNLLVKQIHAGLKTLQYCISSNGYCYVCKQSMEEDDSIKALLFSCGHIYHRQCIEEIHGQDLCFVCISKDQFKGMIQNTQMFLVDLLEKFKSKKIQMRRVKEQQGKAKYQLISIQNKRQNRLGIFDKKVTAIENQAEIIDLKLMIEDYYSSQTTK